MNGTFELIVMLGYLCITCNNATQIQKL